MTEMNKSLDIQVEPLPRSSELESKEQGMPGTAGVKVLPPKPVDAKWTDDQWRAVVDGGANMLVAAAAGSGKTAVLVERIIRKISDIENPVHVDQLLVATFTKAAAAEMRERIRIALEQALERNPE